MGLFGKFGAVLKHVRPRKKKQNVSRPDFYKKKESGRELFFVISNLFNIYNPMLSLHITTLPQLGISWSS